MQKRLAATLSGALLLTSTLLMAATPKATSYAGKWTLDRTQSRNLPKYYEHVASHTLDVTQSETALEVAVTVTAAEHEPDHFNFHYDLNGEETSTTTKIRTQAGPTEVPTKLKATRGAKGGLSISIARQFEMNGEQIKAVTIETWELSADSKTLTVHRADDSPRGKMECDMVFVRG
jgi:hypothetical protein